MSLAVEAPAEVVQLGDSELPRLDIALNAEVYVLSEFVVAGQREGNAAAIAEQRFAPNVTNIITADAFGDITKANVGNRRVAHQALVRLTTVRATADLTSDP